MPRRIGAWIAALTWIAASPAVAEDALRLHVLDCGSMKGVETEEFLPGLEDRPERVDMTSRCFLVVHPKGTLLWDVGFPDAFSFHALTWIMWLTSLGETVIEGGEPVLPQMERLGVDPDDLDYLAVSHVHFDHAGQANEFANAIWLVQKAERDWIFSEDLDNPYVDPSLVAELEDAETIELTGDHDVFGDGSVEILSSPGHTPGHQSLYLDLPKQGPVILSGDLYHTVLARQHRIPAAFNVDHDETIRSMERIERIAAERGAEIWIQHAPESGIQAPATVE